MLPVLTPEEAHRLDAGWAGPVTVLMERAGMAVAVEAARLGAGYGRQVLVLAGPGNNGGDGYVAARHLRTRGADVKVFALDSPKTPACDWARQDAEAAGVRIRELADPEPGDLVIDAVFGGGFRGGVPEVLRPWMDRPVRAVDVPTGLDPATGEVEDQSFHAVATVTFHSLKVGHVLGAGPVRCGRVVVADIGLLGGDPSLMIAEEEDCPRPPRPRSAHKWSAGSVLVVGGSQGMLGAAVLAGRAALHFGAGAVGVAVPDGERASVAVLAPELLNFGFEQLPDRFQVLVIGPGLGSDHGHLVDRLLAEHRGPVVLDADGLRSFTDRRRPQTVLTPHAGEFRRLASRDPSPASAAELARATEAVVLLKGNPTLVTDGGAPWVVRSGGPELATIGTGDVLAGMIGALMARGLHAAEAARSAAFWHGMAGASLREQGTVTADRLALQVGKFAW
jgi:hydroxyethylthiazole kinase-like uncharacterized protein yjeF